MESFIQLRVMSSRLKPKELEERVIFRPDESWAAGDKRKDTAIMERENGFAINSLLNKKAPVAEHIANIRERISGTEIGFKSVSNELGCSVLVSCAIYSESAPPIFLDKGLISWMNEIGASLDIDVYVGSDS